MTIATEVRSYADAALLQGKSALKEATTVVTNANKRIEDALPSLSPAAVSAPAFAWIGAADLVAEAVAKRVESLPAEAAANLAKAQQTGKARLTKAQSDAVAAVAELRAKLDASLESAKDLRSADLQTKAADLQTKAADLQTKAKEAAAAYVAAVKNLYDTLSARGEAKLSELLELAKDPRLAKLLADVSEVADTVEAKVRPVVDTVEAKVRPVVDTVETKVSPAFGQLVDQVVDTVKSANPIHKSVAVKPVATKAPAKKAAAKAPAKKAAAKAPATKAPAKKAPAAKKTASTI
jgi:hypothetical protein